MSSPLESTFITSFTAAPCQKLCTLRFAVVFFKKETGSSLNLNLSLNINNKTARGEEKCQKSSSSNLQSWNWSKSIEKKEKNPVKISMSNKVGVKTKHGHDSGELHSFQIHQYPKIRQYPIIRQILWKHSFIHSFIYLFCCCPKFQKFQKFQKFRKFHRKRAEPWKTAKFLSNCRVILLPLVWIYLCISYIFEIQKNSAKYSVKAFNFLPPRLEKLHRLTSFNSMQKWRVF